MSDRNCGDCRHWDQTPAGPPSGVCSAITWAFIASVPDPAYVTDDEGFAELWTAPTFGCTLWEARNE